MTIVWNVGQDDPHDHYPWTWTPNLDQFGGPEVGSIHTPNGPRPDGSMHAYWCIGHDIWEPSGRLICLLVNRWAHEQFGTPIPPDEVLPESDEVRHERFWRGGGDFRWCWPRFDITNPADKRRRFLLNRYPHNVIGAMVVAFGRGWGVRWKKSGR